MAGSKVGTLSGLEGFVDLLRIRLNDWAGEFRNELRRGKVSLVDRVPGAVFKSAFLHLLGDHVIQ